MLESSEQSSLSTKEVKTLAALAGGAEFAYCFQSGALALADANQKPKKLGLNDAEKMHIFLSFRNRGFIEEVATAAHWHPLLHGEVRIYRIADNGRTQLAQIQPEVPKESTEVVADRAKTVREKISRTTKKK